MNPSDDLMLTARNGDSNGERAPPSDGAHASEGERSGGSATALGAPRLRMDLSAHEGDAAKTPDQFMRTVLKYSSDTRDIHPNALGMSLPEARLYGERTGFDILRFDHATIHVALANIATGLIALESRKIIIRNFTNDIFDYDMAPIAAHSLLHLSSASPTTFIIERVSSNLEWLHASMSEEHKYREIIRQINDGICEVVRGNPYDVPPGVTRCIAPMVAVSKHNSNEKRITGDWTSLNEHILHEEFVFPNVQDCLERTLGARVFSAIDLQRGYHTIQLSEASRELAIIATPWGAFRYKRLPMGISSSPALLGKILESALNGPILEGWCSVFADDILIHSTDPILHAEHLNIVLSILAKAGLRVSLPKSKLFQTEVDFLGYITDGKTMRPAPARVQGWASLAPPRTIKEVRTWIGICSYMRSSYPSLEDHLAPYRDIISTRTSGTLPKAFWSRAQLSQFEEMKRILTSTDALAIPNYNLPFVLRTDASDLAIGGSILQEDASGELRPVSYFSHRFSKREAAWNVSERECFAFVFAIHRFSSILKHATIFIETDHAALTFLRSSPNAKINRWWLSLCAYNVTYVRHIRGILNTTADALSRLESMDPLSFESVDPERKWLLATSSAAAGEHAALPPHANFVRLLAGGHSTMSRVDAVLAGDEPLLRHCTEGAMGPLHFAENPFTVPEWMMDDELLNGEATLPSTTYNIDPTLPSTAPTSHTIAPLLPRDIDYILEEDPSRDPLEPPFFLEKESGAALNSLLERVIEAQNEPAAAATRKSQLERGLLATATRRGKAVLVRGNALWLPTTEATAPLRYDILRAVHDAAGHRSAAYLMKSLEEIVQWEKCRRDAVKHVEGCLECKLKTFQPARFKHGLYGDLSTGAPHLCTTIDFVGPFEPSNGEAREPDIPVKYILTVQDNFSRYVNLYPCRHEDGSTVVRLLRHHFCKFGFPASIRSDQGSHFVNLEVKSFLEQHAIAHALSPAYHPESQGRVERLHKTLLEMLRTYTRGKAATWAALVDNVQFFLNSQHHRSLNCSPFEAFFGEPARTPLGNALGAPLPTFTSELARLSALYALRDTIEESSRVATTSSTAHSNISRRPLHIEPGDYVAIWRDKVDGKLDTHFDKIARVISKISDNIIDLRPLGHTETQIVHVDALKLLNAKLSDWETRKRERPLPISIDRHRKHEDGTYSFSVQWPSSTDESPTPPSWVPGTDLQESKVAKDYCKYHNITQKAAFAKVAAPPTPRRPHAPTLVLAPTVPTVTLPPLAAPAATPPTATAVPTPAAEPARADAPVAEAQRAKQGVHIKTSADRGRQLTPAARIPRRPSTTREAPRPMIATAPTPSGAAEQRTAGSTKVVVDGHGTRAAAAASLLTPVPTKEPAPKVQATTTTSTAPAGAHAQRARSTPATLITTKPAAVPNHRKPAQLKPTIKLGDSKRTRKLRVGMPTRSTDKQYRLLYISTPCPSPAPSSESDWSD